MKQPPKHAARALVPLAIALALAPFAAANHVEPTFVEGPDNHTCSEFAPDGEVWSELKVDPAESGVYTDGTLTVTLEVDEAGKVFDWSADLAVVGVVFVKAGSAGHHLYEYEPPEDADTGLTSPGEGDSNQISHISFCYTEPEDVPTCEDFPDMPECQPTCEDFPDMPECQPTCEDFPDMPECQPSCEDFPDVPECQQTCEEAPDMPECRSPCPADVMAIANADGSITVTVVFNRTFDLHRMAEGGEGSVHLGTFDGDTVYEDTDTEVGTTYTYTVTVGPGVCGSVEVTSIPDFTTVVGTVAAAGLGAIGYAFVRRRK